MSSTVACFCLSVTGAGSEEADVGRGGEDTFTSVYGPQHPTIFIACACARMNELKMNKKGDNSLTRKKQLIDTE